MELLKLSKNQYQMMTLAFVCGLFASVNIILDALLDSDLGKGVLFLFYFIVFSPIILRIIFEFQNRTHRNTVLKNRVELFKEIPKDEIFKEGSVFVDKLEGDEN